MLIYIIFSFVQGISEFLPISSSGHLNILANIYQLKESRVEFFILLHFASIISLLVFFWKDIKMFIFKDYFLLLKLTVGIGITALGGILLEKDIDKIYQNDFITPLGFFINGIILFSTRKIKGYRGLKELKFRDVFLVGLVQIFSFFPGVSRSGITISTLLWRKFSYSDAFRLSFIMAIPLIMGATFLKIIRSKGEIILYNHGIFFLSMAITFIVGLLSLFILRRVMEANKFYFFAYYSFILDLLSILF